MKSSTVLKYIQNNSNSNSLSRGKAIYKYNNIKDFNINGYDIQAKVKGTKLYNQKIIIDDNNILSTYCSCPYDYGGICKHTVAVLLKFYDFLEDEQNPFLKNHHTSTWFLIADNNNFSLKKIISDFNPTKQWFNRINIVLKLDVNYADFVLQGWYTHRVEFKIEKDKLFTRCNCSSIEKSICSHQSIVILELADVLDDFFHQVEKSNVDNLAKKALVEYGLSAKNEYLSYFKPAFKNGTVVVLPTGKFAGLVSNKGRGENFINTFNTQLKNINPFFGSKPEDQKNKFELGFVLEQSSISNELNVLQIVPIVGKINKDETKLINPIRRIDDRNANQIQLTQNDEKLITLVNQTDNENINEFIQRNNIANNHLELQTNISSYYNSILPEIFNILKDKKFIYYGDYIEDRKPVKISSSKPKLFYTLSENDDFFELKLNIKLDDKIIDFNKIRLAYFASFTLIFNNIVYLINSVQDDLIISNAVNQGDAIISTKENFEYFFNEYVKPISGKYQIKTELKSIALEETQISKKTKQLFISEVDKFVIFTPVVQYNDNYQANIFERERVLNFLDNKIISINRDTELEKEFLESVKQLHPNFENQKMLDYFFLSYDDFLKNYWFFEAFDKLSKQNIEVFGFDKLSKLKYNPNRAKVAVQIKSEIDWFDLELNISFGDFNVSLKDVRKAILKKERFVKLADGSIGVLPEEWVKKLEAYFRQGELKKDKIKISKLKFNFIDQLFKDINNTEVLKEIAEKRQKLKEFTSIEKISIPKKLNGALRDYQIAGFNWLNFLNEFKWGGILADDMGLGKTIQIISFLLKIHNSQKNASLVIVPTTLLFNWENELKKFAPSLNVYFHYGTSREAEKIDVKNHDVIITSYGIMMRDIKLLKKYKFTYVILDESQAIKNPESLRFKASMLLKAENKIAMTGTPIENNTFDLYAQMEFLNPGFLGSKSMFKEMYSDPIDKGQQTSIAKELQKVINPFILRRTKEQVASELPDKVENFMFCEMPEEQRKVYEAFRNKYRDMLMNKIEEDGLGKSKIYIIEGLMKLRQICDSPAILSDEEDYGNESVKINELLRHIKEKTGNHKILVFSQFVKMLSQIKTRLDAEKISYEYLDGQSSQKKRQESVNNFQSNDKIRVFLISLKAGGTGINLTSADYVYLVDPWWNPAVESQAIDRTHRIGQDKKVIAYRMICKNTIEEKIMKYQERKLKVATDIISTEENFVKQLSKNDISDLFS